MAGRKEIVILDPIQEAPEQHNPITPRLGELNNKTIGVRHHASWTKYKVFHETITSMLKERYGITDPVYEFNVPGSGLGPKRLDAFANKADAAIFGLAA